MFPRQNIKAFFGSFYAARKPSRCHRIQTPHKFLDNTVIFPFV